MDTQEFINKFKYTPDRIDSWRVIKDFPYSNDCDDFSAIGSTGVNPLVMMHT
jgi:hypothetical protein